MAYESEYFVSKEKSFFSTNDFIIGVYCIGFGLGGIAIWLFSNTLLKTFIPRIAPVIACIIYLIFGMILVVGYLMKTNVRRSR